MYFKKEKTKKNIIALTAVMCAFIVFGSLVNANTPSNVIVASVNYVDQKFEQLSQKISQLEAKIGTGGTRPTYPSPTDPKQPVDNEKLDDLEKKVDVIKQQLDNYYSQQIIRLSEANQYNVVVLEKGQKIVASGVVEFIVRGGICTAISGSNGDGIADMTSGDGEDFYTGDTLPKNHYMLISRGDGRGIEAVSDTVYIMVKGQYSIRLPEK